MLEKSFEIIHIFGVVDGICGLGYLSYEIALEALNKLINMKQWKYY